MIVDGKDEGPKFCPIHLHLTFESEEEVNAFYGLLNNSVVNRLLQSSGIPANKIRDFLNHRRTQNRHNAIRDKFKDEMRAHGWRPKP